MSSKKRKYPANPKIAERVKAAMAHHDVNAEQLATKIRRTPSAVSQLLSGGTQPENGTVDLIAEALGEDYAFLMGHIDRGSKGYGALFGDLMTRLSADEAIYLHSLEPDALHALIHKHALEEAAAKQKVLRLAKKPKKD